MDLGSLSRLLARGAQGVGAGAREEARRVLEVLVERGDLSPDEARQVEAGVADAVETHRRWVEERVVAPLGRVLRGAAGGGALAARLAALEERLARIEAALAARDADE